MVSKFVSYVSVLAVLTISLSFCMFAIDEAKLASNAKKAEAEGLQAQPAVVLRDEHGRQLGRGEMRTRIDGVSDELTGPFELVVTSNDPWFMRFAALLMGLAFWGFVLQWLARSLSVWSNGTGRPPHSAHAPT